jgi:DNA-binding XRE family transcriptional regulator
MPNDSEVDQVLSEFRDWCKAEYGRQAEAARTLGATRQQIYDWTSMRKRPSIEMWLRIQSFLKHQRPRKAGAKT